MPRRSTTPSTSGRPSSSRARAARSAPSAALDYTSGATGAPAPSATTHDPLTFIVRLTPNARDLLERLLASGLWGWTLEDAAARLIDRGLERAQIEGLLRR